MYRVLIILLVCLSGCTDKKPIKVDDIYIPKHSANELYDRYVNTMNAKNDSVDLEIIFREWNKSISPNSEEFINQNDTITAIYSIFKEIYKPYELLKLGKWEWGNQLNSNSKYVVVQNEIYYGVLDENTINYMGYNGIDNDSIVNFRPPVAIDRSKVLYLTSEYNNAIQLFLGNGSTQLGEGDIMNPSRPIGDSRKRYEILRPFIPVLHNHWGDGWHIATHPYILNITLNNKLTEAKVYFRIGYQGGAAIVKRLGESWLISESSATWIE